MPQLDIFLWFSQIFWLVIFMLGFISFIFILYIPITCYIEDFSFFKIIDNYNSSNNLFLSYSNNIQDFLFYYKGIC